MNTNQRKPLEINQLYKELEWLTDSMGMIGTIVVRAVDGQADREEMLEQLSVVLWAAKQRKKLIEEELEKINKFSRHNSVEENRYSLDYVRQEVRESAEFFWVHDNEPKDANPTLHSRRIWTDENGEAWRPNTDWDSTVGLEKA